MKKQQGFTLIELLVVVLIIGILSSIALPQYQKAVEKSRLTEALLNMNIVQKNIELYILEKGNDGAYHYKHPEWTIDLAGGEWDDDVTYISKLFNYDVNDNTGILVSRCTPDCVNPTGSMYELWQGYPYIEDNKKICWGYTPIGKSICKSLEGQGWINESED